MSDLQEHSFPAFKRSFNVDHVENESKVKNIEQLACALVAAESEYGQGTLLPAVARPWTLENTCCGKSMPPTGLWHARYAVFVWFCRDVAVRMS